MFYVTGDSHRALYLDNDKIRDCGDYKTIYKFTKMLNEGLILHKDIKENDYVLCVYGEVDIRHHFKNQNINFNRCINEIIKTLCDDFILALKQINARIIVRGIVPPLPNEYHNFGGKNSITCTFEERIEWRKIVNDYLKQKCIDNNFIYLQSPIIVENEDGSMKLEMSDYVIHILETPEMRSYAFNDLMNVCL